MKKQLWGAVLCVAALGLSGCGSQAALTEQQTNEAAEYIAGMMLKYDKGYTDVLVYPEATEEPAGTETPAGLESEDEQEVQNSGDGQQENIGNPRSLSSLYGADRFSVKCTNVYKTKEYKDPDNNMIVVNAQSGKKLVAVEFSVKNITNKERKLRLLEKGIAYQLTVDGSSYDGELSLVTQDMNFANTKIKANGKWKGVVLFQVPAKTALQNVKLTATKNGKSVSVALDGKVSQ